MEATGTPAGSRPLAVVTGASSGIGRELAARFAEVGFDLVVAAEDERIGAVAMSFAEHGIQSVPVRADLSTFDGVEELYRTVQSTGRTPEAVAINAGIGVGGGFTRDNELADELRDTGVTTTALMPGPTDTEFFDPAGMQGTKLREQTSKDDPAEIAREGFDALLVPGGQAEYLRVPMAHFGPIKVPQGTPDERFLYLSDILPTAWQAVEYADIPQGGTVTVYGLGPVGQFCARIARHRGARVFGVDYVPERREIARRHGITVLDPGVLDDVPQAIRELTGGRGTDSVIDAVGMEAHGTPSAGLAQKLVGLLPDAAAQQVMQKAGVDRLQALTQSIETVCRGGTISISGVYGGTADPLNMLQLFDKGVKLAMGQAHVKRWIDHLMPLLIGDGDPLGVEDLCTHRLPLSDAPHGYEIFQKKQDGAIKVVLKP